MNKTLVGLLLLLGVLAPGTASALVIAEQPVIETIEFKQGNAPIVISGTSENYPSFQTELTNLSGVARSVRLKYDITGGPDLRALQITLRECPTALSTDGFSSCRSYVARDLAYGWDGGLIYVPDPDGKEIVIDMRSVTDFQGHEFTDGVPLNPTRSYKLFIFMAGNQYTAAFFGKDGLHGFEAYFSLEDTVGTPTVSATTTPHVATGKTYGSLNGDRSYQRQYEYTPYQNLGNGSFSEGSAVTGVDVRLGSHVNNKIGISLDEYIPELGGVTVSHRGAMQFTSEGDTTYHFDLEQPFTPEVGHCYRLVMYQQFSATSSNTFYGHTSDVYQADSTGCTSGFNSDDRSEIENPAYREPGVIDHTFVIHTNGSTTPATTTPPVCTVNCNSNVMFLPGVGGSRLYRPTIAGELGSEHMLWEPNDDLDVAGLQLNEFGKEEIGLPQAEIYTRDVLDEAYVGNAGPNIYKSFMGSMDDLVEAPNSKIAEWSAVPYDWRLSLDDILNNGTKTVDGKISYLQPTEAPYVMAELMRLASTSRTGKVTVVAHSNGGLVIKALLVAHPELNQYIDKLIFVAVPQVGTPQAIAALMHGDRQGLPADAFPALMSAPAGRQFSVNAPVAYNLLPSVNYFTYVDDPVVTFDVASLPEWADTYGSIIHSEELMGNYLTDSYGRVSASSAQTAFPVKANGDLLLQAQATHAALDSWAPPSNIQLIQIAGWGIPKTLMSLDYSSSTKFCTSFCEPAFTMTASTTVDGDGTVVVPSALWATSTLPNVKNYWVNIDAYNLKERSFLNRIRLGLGHKDILEIPSLVDLISNQVAEIQGPAPTYQYVTPNPPTSVNKRLRYALHSPLTLDLFDELGNHTGISTTTGQIEEGVPGTYFAELGGVKYLYTGAASTSHIVMSGYAPGTFTLNIDQYTGDSPTEHVEFKDIPTTPQTRVGLDAISDIHTLSRMRIDTNGDDVIDVSLTPIVGATTFYDAAPPEAVVGFSSTTKTVRFTGTDNLSVPVVATSSTSVKISDSSGNSLILNIAKNTMGASAATLVIPSIRYSNGSTTNATTTLRYFWTTDKAGKYTLFISAIKTPTDRVLSIYTALTNKTYVVSTTPSDDSGDLSLQSALLLLRNKTKSLNGLVIPGVFTKQGTITVGY